MLVRARHYENSGNVAVLPRYQSADIDNTRPSARGATTTPLPPAQIKLPSTGAGRRVAGRPLHVGPTGSSSSSYRRKVANNGPLSNERVAVNSGNRVLGITLFYRSNTPLPVEFIRRPRNRYAID